MKTDKQLKPFGSYGFTNMQKAILLLVKLGISRGKMKKLVHKLWNRHSAVEDMFDIEYHGIRMRLSPYGNQLEQKILFTSRFRDKAELDCILNMPADGVFVDIGANMGYYGLIVAHRLPNAKIITFEPNPEMYEMLMTNIALNNFEKSITALPEAVGDEIGTASLTFSKEHYVCGTLNQDVKVEGENESCTVATTTLQAALQKAGGEGVQKIHALKIDVEGFEDKALLPYFRSVDKKFWPDIIVIEDDNVEVWEENVIQFMTENGYRKIGRTRSNVLYSLSNQ